MYNRICIIGGSGSGKTTLADILSKFYNIPAIHIDSLNYLPNWEKRNIEERDNAILSHIKNDKWIIDGNYNSTLKPRLENSDLIIWLDYSTFAHLKGVLKRFFTNFNKEKSEIPGCKERLSPTFLKYVLLYNKNKRNIIVDNLKDIPKDKILIFKKQKDLNKWIKSLKK